MNDSPYLSVIMPVRNGTGVLPRSIAALDQSDLPRSDWELIVVDDGSLDDTAPMARALGADEVVRLVGKARGPSYARNRGFEHSSGEIIVFVDADVCVHPGTLRQFADLFRTQPEVSAAFGSYDDRPPDTGFVSQYRNLYHHYIHHQNPGEAETFWAGCGAVRSDAFAEVGMYNEWHFSRPQVEDIELGHRLNDLGHKILLRPDIQATHLKRWTLAGVLTTDLNDRGVPWTRLLIRRGSTTKSKSLNLKTVEKINTGLVALALVAMVMAALLREPLLLVASGGALLPVLFNNRRLYYWFARKRGWLFALGVVPLNLIYYVVNALSVWWGAALQAVLGDPQPPVETEAFAEVGVESWPPVPRRAPEPGTRSPPAVRRPRLRGQATGGQEQP